MARSPKKLRKKSNNKRSFGLFVILAIITSSALYAALTLRAKPASINQIAPNSSLPTPVVTVLDSLKTSNMYFNDDTGWMNAEVTPWLVDTTYKGAWNTYLVSTFNTHLCTTPSNIFTLTAEEQLKNRSCTRRLEPALSGNTFTQINALPLWKRDYHGAFSAHIIPTQNQGPTLYSVNHSESYNNSNLKQLYPSLPSCVAVNDMGYGKLPCEDKYWWGSYNAWITLSSMPWTYANLTSNTQFNDHGPITWPSNGYIESLDNNKTWIKATDGGVRHPSSIIKDNYLYVFYEDTSQGSESQGRGPGIKVIRAEITPNGIDPKSFRAYYNGSFSDPTLSPAFDLSTYYRWLSRKGPRASNLFPHLVRTVPSPTLGTKRDSSRLITDIISFSVAKIKNTPYYLSVSHELSRGLTLRLSTDLVNWSEATVVPSTESNWWAGNLDLQTNIPLLYPRLANKEGSSNTEIDANEFYIIGTQTKKRGNSDAKVVNQIKLSLNLQ